MEIVVHSKKSVSLKFQKKLYHYNRNTQYMSDVKNDQIEHSESDKEIRIPVFLRIPPPQNHLLCNPVFLR